MKKFITVLSVMISFCTGWGLYSRSVVEETVAQTADLERQKRMDWDNSLTEEKYKRLRKESRELQESIKKVDATNFPKFKISSADLGDPAAAGLGRKGQITWHVSWD